MYAIDSNGKAKMPKDETAWTLMLENASLLNGACVLCYHGIEKGWGLAYEPHHIKPKQMGGTDNEFVLKDKRNIAPACLPHHQMYQQNRAIWVRYMSLPPLNFDYKDTPLSEYITEG